VSPQQKGRSAAHRRAEQLAAREAERRRQQRLRGIVIGVLGAVVVLAIIGSLLSVGGGDDDDADSDAFASTTTTAGSSSSTIADTPVEGAEFTYGTTPCAPDRKPETVPDSFPDSFQSCLKPDSEYKAVVGTSEGTFTIDLLPQRAPGTVNNFVQLAKSGWFDGNSVHRIVPGFVNQTGDRVGNPPGTGNPGYAIADELPSSVDEYVPGAVAMANSGPNTNGSQWFTCVDCSLLPTPGYSLFGFVSDGMDVVQAINDLGTSDGAPAAREVTIVAVEILENPLSEEEGEGVIPSGASGG
jgi:cyclophilin family peptidyl-prolyl cis-trans isomerase